jgi:hypothetical protein
MHPRRETPGPRTTTKTRERQVYEQVSRSAAAHILPVFRPKHAHQDAMRAPHASDDTHQVLVITFFFPDGQSSPLPQSSRQGVKEILMITVQAVSDPQARCANPVPEA